MAIKKGRAVVADIGDELSAEIRLGDDRDYHLIVSYVTETSGPPHRVILRDSVNGWVDVPMKAVVASGRTTWTIDLRSTPDEGPTEFEFKLVLDGERWMAGENQSGTTAAPQTTLTLDDATVVWEE